MSSNRTFFRNFVEENLEVMEIEKWKVLGSEYIIKRPWLTARVDKVQLPNGVVHPEYYVLEYPNWVNIIAITTEGKFVMVEQYRHGLADIFTELVAGVVEDGEEPLHAAKRSHIPFLRPTSNL